MNEKPHVFSGEGVPDDTPYVIQTGNREQRKAVADWLVGLEHLGDTERERVITAWITVLCSSRFTRIEDIPFYPKVAGYRLWDHVNDVTSNGILLGRSAKERWGYELNQSDLVCSLILHDIDKPIIHSKLSDGTEGFTKWSKQIPHGVIGGMLLKELQFPMDVVSVVTTHAGNMPFHADHPISWVLHYADYFSADHACLSTGNKPFFQHPIQLTN
ncbi:MAG: HD domain-containing protein [Acetobacteraceae bacterium]|nr:HD domain-containing protein [Acetobacteraceae bacterium]